VTTDGDCDTAFHVELAGARRRRWLCWWLADDSPVAGVWRQPLSRYTDMSFADISRSYTIAIQIMRYRVGLVLQTLTET